MARCVTLFTCLLLSLSAGFGTYALGAIVWCVIDPEDVGAKMLFTIPPALAGMAIPGIIGMLCWTFRCDLIPERKAAKTVAAAAVRAPRPVRATDHLHDDDDVELALAT
jgi:hypothetical protein